MPTPFVRYLSGGTPQFGRLVSAAPSDGADQLEVAPLVDPCATTAALIASKRQACDHTLTLSAHDLLSPVTGDRQIICQGLNYGKHAAESGHKVRNENLFFAKAASSLAGPFEDILCPPEVQLLDYEVEIGLVIRCALTSPVRVTDAEVGRYVAGVVLCNDLSARDIMFGASYMQWFQGKSYRGFCPTGPVLWLLEPKEAPGLLEDLAITLDWNGERRQSADTSQLLYRPAETISQLSSILDLHAGDLILTGTPGGVIAHGTPKVVEILSSKLVADAERRDALRAEMLAHARFIRPGDVITAELSAPSAGLSLGGQRNRIVAGATAPRG